MPLRKRALLPVLLGALFVSGCAEKPKRLATPAVFMIRDDDTMLFVTGTVHLLPSDIDWRSPAINRAMSAADELVTELSPAELGRIGDIAPTYAKAVSATPAGDRFAPDLRDDFADFAGDQNIAADQMAAIDDWAIALTLAQASARSAGLSADYGMDRALTATFARAGKRQSGLELATDQLGAFDAIPASEQRLMLNRLMRDIADGRADDRLHEMIAAWSAGDLDALAAIIARDANLAPQANRIMLTDRNRKWSDWIIKRLERPGTTLVAVGAGHLAGPDSLIAILAARGIAAQRLN